MAELHKGAIGDRDGNAAHDVIDDLVPHQDPQRIGAGIPVQFKADDRLLLPEARIFVQLLEYRLINRGDTILGRAAREYFIEVDRLLGEVCLLPALRLPDRRLGGCLLKAERQHHDCKD